MVYGRPRGYGARGARGGLMSSAARKISWTSAELLNHEFPPVPWVVEGLLPSGLTVLAGAPKLGKSWLALAICQAVSLGGAVLSRVKVERRRTLMLAREDTARRLQSRLQKLKAEPSDQFHAFLEWPRGHEGVAHLYRWMEKYPDTGLIVIDTWGKFRQVKNGDDYDESVQAASELKALADEFDVAVVLIHHARKNAPADGDWMDSLLGSTGLAATVDTGMLLRRGRGNRDATLSITGRDVEENEFVLEFDVETGTWALTGTTAEVQESAARQEILDLLTESEPMSPKAVARELEKNYHTTKNLLLKMARDGAVQSLSGKYTAVVRSLRSPVVSDYADYADHETTQTTETTHTHTTSPPLKPLNNEDSKDTGSSVDRWRTVDDEEGVLFGRDFDGIPDF